MAGLTAEQRDGIVRRCAGLVATYFTSSALRVVSVEVEPQQLSPRELEFHDYLRLSTLLPAGSRLCGLLGRVALAPAIEQQVTVRTDRGQLSGPIDPAAYARRAGQRSTPRSFPVRRISVHHATAENIIAVSAAIALLGELQRLVARIKLPAGATEAVLATQTIDALHGALGSAPLADVVDHGVDPRSESMTQLLSQVDERWRSRRISNTGYAEIAQWVATHRHHHLEPQGLLGGVAYGDDFDNRLFEIFSLFCVRTGLELLGFSCTIARPLHLAKQLPSMEFTHPEGSSVLEVYFQRAGGVAWTPTAQRHWSAILGIPDIIISARSPVTPIVLIDAKNRDRGDDATDDTEDEPLVGRHATSDELHKMLGYFSNFGRRTRVGKRGPVGGLLFSSTSGSSDVWLAESDYDGVLGTIAVDPLDAALTEPDGPATSFIEPLLRAAGLFGGLRPDGWPADAELRAVHATLPDPDTEEALAQREQAIHAWIEQHYGSDPSRVAATESVLETHVLGDPWHALNGDEQRFLATAEIFWQDHAGTVGMDFGPVVIEIAKAFESLASRKLIEPFRRWADTNSRDIGQVATIGDIRAELERVTQMLPGVTRPKGARSLCDYLDVSGRRAAAIDSLLPVLTRLNPLRRDAAHPHRVTSRVAAQCRAWTLGIGSEPCALSLLASTL